MYYILHGEDEFSRSLEIEKMRAKMGDPQFVDLNTAAYDGRALSLGELQHACDAVPFLSDKRLVIVEGMLARFERHQKKGAAAQAETGDEPDPVNPELAKGLTEYLAQLPETTRLVFVETKTLAKTNPILKHALGDKERGYVKAFQPPRESTLPRWIQDRVGEKKGAIALEAAQELAAHIGPDLRLLDNEIEKLLAYCGEGTIGIEDVRALVPSVRESSVFDLVDAIGERKTKRALDLLHDQLAHRAEPLPLFAMITRQFRLLLQTKDLGTRGMRPSEMAGHIKQNPFVITKTSEQAKNFSLAQLEVIYRKLLETDLAIKTGRSDAAVALDTLIVDLTR